MSDTALNFTALTSEHGANFTSVGLFEWELTVEPGKAEIDLLPFRYLGWVGPAIDELATTYRTAYRRALAALVRSLAWEALKSLI